MDATQSEIMEMKNDIHLGKKLAYLLRYGAINEGLELDIGGFVSFDKLMELPMMEGSSREYVLKHLKYSVSVNGAKRFETKTTVNGEIFVRSKFSRVMDPLIYHPGTNVSRLVNSCLDFIAKNILCYDLQDFPDEYLLRLLFRKLKRSFRLTNKAFRSLISSATTSYNLSDVYVTEATLKLVCQRCPSLIHLNLKANSYLVTDVIVIMLAKRLHNLQNINISDCKSVTDVSLNAFIKQKTPLIRLNISYCPLITRPGLHKFICSCKSLESVCVQGFHWMNETVAQEMKNDHQNAFGKTMEIYHLNFRQLAFNAYRNNEDFPDIVASADEKTISVE